MKVLIDLNILLDVIQKRPPFFEASAAVLSAALDGRLEALIPAHAITTIHYVTARHLGKTRADSAVDWILEHYAVAAEGIEQFRRARSLQLRDFEDAVVAAVAEAEGCQYIVTRNLLDFTGAPVEPILPELFLTQMEASR